jgi:hypothetical protein
MFHCFQVGGHSGFGVICAKPVPPGMGFVFVFRRGKLFGKRLQSFLRECKM